MHRLDLCLYSHPTEFGGGGGGMESKPMRRGEKSPLPEKNSHQRKIEPTTLHQAGQ